MSVRANESNLGNELAGKQSDEPTYGQRFLEETPLSPISCNNPSRAHVFRRGRKDQPAARRTTSMSSLHEDGMLARANKIKAMFGVQLKEQATLPGVSREKTGKGVANCDVDPFTFATARFLIPFVSLYL